MHGGPYYLVYNILRVLRCETRVGEAFKTDCQWIISYISVSINRTRNDIDLEPLWSETNENEASQNEWINYIYLNYR